MTTKQSPWVVYSDFCDAWEALLYSKDRGKIRNLFNQEREALIKHLSSNKCAVCLARLNKIINLTDSGLQILEQASPDEFREFTGSIYKEAQKQLPSSQGAQTP